MSEATDLMGDDLPTPTNPDDARDLVWMAYRSQFAYVSRGARLNRIAYQTSKIAAIIVAAAVTICAALSVAAWVTASLGGVVVVIQGLQQLFQWQMNWITARQSSETMRQHGLAYALAWRPTTAPTAASACPSSCATSRWRRTGRGPAACSTLRRVEDVPHRLTSGGPPGAVEADRALRALS